MKQITENQFNAGYKAAVEKAQSLNENIREIWMNEDEVEIYGVEDEDNLKEIKKAFYQAAGQL